MTIYRVFDERFGALIDESQSFTTLAEGFRFTEGATWHPVARLLTFSDIPASRIHRWSAASGRTATLRDPSAMTNGMTYDHEGRLLMCEHATSRVTRLELDGATTVLAERWQGNEFNSPNDIVVDDRGTIWFTDPLYGRQAETGVAREPGLAFQGVFSIDRQGSLGLVADDYGYNAAGQKISQSVSDPAYIWRPAANDNTAYAPTTLNVYDSVGGVLYDYDANGNLTDDGTDDYSYDAENQLTQATVGATISTYRFDPSGRRTEKDVGGTITEFLSDGDNVVGEYDGLGNLVARYVQGPGLDSPVLMERAGARSYYHFDVIGSVVALSGATGFEAERYAYSPYGESSDTSPAGNPYRYTGRRLDEETGLYYYRARMYSVTIGRFLQPDPAGFIDGPNLYAYVGNDPLSFVDPLGLGRAELGGGSNFFQPVQQFGSQLYNTFSSEIPRGLSRDFRRFRRNTLGFIDSVASSFGVGKAVGATAGGLKFVASLGGISRAQGILRGMPLREAKSLMSKWDKSTYKTISKSIKDHAARHGFGDDIPKYLRKAANFNEKGASSKVLDDGAVRYKRKSGEYLIKRDGKIVSYGLE